MLVTWEQKVNLAARRLQWLCSRLWGYLIQMDQTWYQDWYEPPGYYRPCIWRREIIPITEQLTGSSSPEAPSIAETLTIVDDDADVEETTIATSEETQSGW